MLIGKKQKAKQECPEVRIGSRERTGVPNAYM